jgi:hypothetical protein
MLADAAFVIITVAFAAFVESLADVAVIVTLPPVGTVAGAVYTVAAALAVGVTLNDPQEPAGVQLHTTGRAAGSFVVVAAIDAVVPVCIAPGGGVVSVIVITGPVIVTVALFVLVVSLTAVAVIVTLPPDGTVVGPVYTVVAPLAVLVGVKLPQVPAGVQLHVTPPFAGSFMTVATIFAVPDTPRLAGGAVEKVTAIPREMTPDTDLLPSATEVAVMVTVPPDGAVIGAVYVVAAPLAVDVGLKLPQVPAGVQLHVTPLAAESLDTVTDKLVVAPNAMFAGGAAEKLTEIACVPPPEEPPPQPVTTKITATVVRMSVFLMAIPPRSVRIPW